MILFSQVHESYLVELQALSQIKKELKDILVVCSGGCTVLSLMNDKINIDVIDSDITQLCLLRLKIAIVFKTMNKFDYLNVVEGRKCVDKNFINELNLSNNEKEYWIKNIEFFKNGINNCGALEKVFDELITNNYNFNECFNKEYLSGLFGENAVKHSGDFIEHFKSVMKKYEQDDNNYFYDQILNKKYDVKKLYPMYLDNFFDISKNKDKIKYRCNNLIEYLQNTLNMYDMIQTSNITDWISHDDRIKLIELAYTRLNNNGCLVLRRLNGDYNLTELCKDKFDILEVYDKSHFYSEVLICQKN